MIAINNIINSEYSFDSTTKKMVYKLEGEIIFEQTLPTDDFRFVVAMANAIEKSYQIGSKKTIEDIDKAWEEYSGRF